MHLDSTKTKTMNEMKNEQDSCVLMERYSVNTYSGIVPVRPRCQQSRHVISYEHCCPMEHMFQGGRQHKINSGTVTLLCNVKKKTNYS